MLDLIRSAVAWNEHSGEQEGPVVVKPERPATVSGSVVPPRTPLDTVPEENSEGDIKRVDL